MHGGLKHARAYVFCRENDWPPKASVKGAQQHHAPEEHECLVVNEGFPLITLQC
jgi:hypothetical protein